MSLLVQKFGGTSLGSVKRIQHVADRILEAKQAGHDVIVIVSAMSGQTDFLESLATEITSSPNPRELDVLFATGEQVSISLLAISLINKGYNARSFTGAQVKIVTDNVHNKARIVNIHGDAVKNSLSKGEIPIVAGFQGVDDSGNITTLGRGGSDTTAVAFAAEFAAAECQIFTDVEGVCTTDPRIVPAARKMDRITFEEMLELSSLGAKVLQIRSVEFAGRHNVPLRVLSTFIKGTGTLITYEDDAMEQPVVSGIAFNKNEAKLSVLGVTDTPGIAGKILGQISDAGIEVDMIVQNGGQHDTTDFSFTIAREDYEKSKEILFAACENLPAKEIVGDTKVVKVSLVGVGMRSHAGIASKMFRVLGAEGINIQMITTSEIKVSVVVDEKYSELAVRALHTAFGLDASPAEEVL